MRSWKEKFKVHAQKIETMSVTNRKYYNNL